MPETEPEYDVVVWGATGFTGRLAARHLWETYGVGRQLRWALGGRNPDKLRALQQELAPGGTPPPIVLGDSLDPQAMEALAARTRVVCSAVGPYAVYGGPLVAACAARGTSYCDLAGETPWIREMIDRHHETARRSGARIVHCCGFDSIPSDLGVEVLQHAALERWGRPCRHVKLRVKAMRGGGVSGGTVASALALIEASRRDPTVLRRISDPYVLNPPGDRTGPDRVDLAGVAYDADAGTWIAPFVMAAVNTRIVRRTQALRGHPYGRDFCYDEAVMTSAGWWGRGRALAIAASMGVFPVVRASPVLRAAVAKFLPKPGQGPTAAQQEAGFFDLRLIGQVGDGRALEVEVTGDRDPGYSATGKMLGESAVCLALDVASSSVEGGVLTPVAAMGAPLRHRLTDKARMRFEVRAVD